MDGKRRSWMESIGVYLPPHTVSTKDIVAGCARRVMFPLERLTGIESRHMAGDTEFGFDLAVKAIEECLGMSQYGPDDIDLVVSCNISQWDGPDAWSFEPGRAVRLRAVFGLHHALAFDVTNACAGMFTGIRVVDALIRSGAIRRGLVVSGEYITNLTLTAQKEIKGLADPRLACLTLGDAGAAVIIDGTDSDEIGFHALDLYTMGRHSDLCIAKITDQPHGGGIMTTDMVSLAKISVAAYLQHSAMTTLKLGWAPDAVDHIIPHQTSRFTLETGSREVQRFADQRGFAFKDKLINIVARRGNTASTSHFVALKDSIREGKIKSGETVVFGIVASGITIGTGVYRLDDLPDRVGSVDASGGEPRAFRRAPQGGSFLRAGAKPRVRLEAVGHLDPNREGDPDTMTLLTEAAEICLGRSQHPRGKIDILINSGLYRTDYLCEPALAALLAGALKINDAPRTPMDKKTLAFDVVNSGLGLLNACYLASEIIRGRSAKVIMIAASEIENNARHVPDCLRGIRETASAVVLDASPDGETGFGTFLFRFFPELASTLQVHTSPKGLQIDGRNLARQFVESDPGLNEHLTTCVSATVREILDAEGLAWEDIRVILPPQISPAFMDGLAAALGCEREKLVDVSTAGADLFTSSLPYAMARLADREDVGPGDRGLIINIGAGLEVGCALYHF